MELYNGNDFNSFSRQLVDIINKEINTQSDNYILNVNIDDYTSYLFDKYKLDFPELLFDEVFVDTFEKDIPSRRFPNYELMAPGTGKSYRKQVIVYHIPFTGDISLLQLIPNPRVIMTYPANIDNKQKCILIEIINFDDDPEKIKKQYAQEKDHLTCNYSNLKNNCNAFNNRLEILIKEGIESRRQKVLQKNNIISSLGVPIKRNTDIPETFSVPKPELKNKIVVKPVVVDKEFKPEPSLDYENFHKILKIINDVGKNFERMPSTYKGKSEEDIRDHLLLILDPNFEYGSASGETFNKTGKTDISLRYDSNVVFIAECKYWKGEKMLLKTIDQILSYLTWRDSKVAIINFVQNKEFTDVLIKMKNTVKTHPNYVKELSDTDQTWFNYKLHLNEDRNRELDLAVISFHLPT